MSRIKGIKEYCINCRLCEVACRVRHSGTDNIIKAYASETLGPARINVQDSGVVSFALPCRHCNDPRCVEACIMGALTKDDETGAVVHDEDKCLGCWSCIMVCPYGAITINNATGKAASKCDLCADKGEPACVSACPNRALVLVECENND